MKVDPPKINVREHWMLPLSEREFQLDKLRLHEEALALQASEQILYRGKLIDPEDYPCQCTLMEPNQCWEDKHSNAHGWQKNKYGFCKCRCHTNYEPW
jgi:hypothetical protein